MGKKLIPIIFSLFLVVACFTAAMPGRAATHGGSDQERWVHLSTSDTNRSSTANVTLPETLPVNATQVEGNLTYKNLDNGGTWDSPNVTHWINVTFYNDTWTSNTFTVNKTLGSNNTVTYSIATNVPEGNYTVDVSLEDNTGGSDIASDLNTVVIGNTEYMLQYTIISLIMAFLPIIIVIRFVFPYLKSLTEDMDSEM